MGFVAGFRSAGLAGEESFSSGPEDDIICGGHSGRSDWQGMEKLSEEYL